MGPALAVGENHENLGLEERRGVVADHVVRLSAGHDQTKRQKRFTIQQLLDVFRGRTHTQILPRLRESRQRSSGFLPLDSASAEAMGQTPRRSTRPRSECAGASGSERSCGPGRRRVRRERRVAGSCDSPSDGGRRSLSAPARPEPPPRKIGGELRHYAGIRTSTYSRPASVGTGSPAARQSST